MPPVGVRALALGVVLLAALALRAPFIEWLPTPCGDEGNWSWYGRELAAGRGVSLDPDARFVSLAFARLIAASIRLVGLSFSAVRAPLIVGLCLGIIASFALLTKLRAHHAALSVAAALAVHPWAVLWSRTATVPYALALCTMVAAHLALLSATRDDRAWRWLSAGALLALGMHFTPLAALAVVACGLWLLASPQHRPRLRTRGPWLALLACVVIAAPVVLSAMDVARAGATRPRHLFTQLDLRVEVYLRTLLGALSGEATLRHFVGPRASSVRELVGAALCALTLLLASRARRDDDATTVALSRMTRWSAITSLVGTGLLLAPARTWNLPAVDAERYGFVALVPMLLALATLSSRPRQRAWPWALVALWLLGPTRETLTALHRGTGADHGAWTLANGGGYRGWKTPADPRGRALVSLIADEAHALRRGAPLTIVVADYAFHTLPFATGDAPIETVDVARRALPPTPGRAHLFVRWRDGLLAPNYLPRDDVDANAALDALMRSPRFTGLRMLRRVDQRDGAPLVELWAATHAGR